ncbi:hypothetical protein FRC02_002815 [Tulasnella sp. 418]|nr:hypothetical protein FRC02_002815 [Tulasnella sp. 418]
MLKRGEACTECRRRKLKCDGAKPGPCNQCAANNRECRYEQPPPFVPVSTVLQQRIEELEERLKNLTDSHPHVEINEEILLISDGNTPLVPPPEMAGPWWEMETLAAPVRNYLVGIFLANKHHCQFYIDVPRFLMSLANPGLQQPHPGLMEAIYLLACYFTSRLAPDQNLEKHEGHFLARARKALADSLSFSDRLLDFLKGSNLVTAYLYMRGRFLEAYHSHCGTASCALSCGLHSIRSGVYSEDPSGTASTPSLLPPPRDQAELSERILTFWPIYYWDKLGAIITGFVESFVADPASTECIETPFPRPIEEYHRGVAGRYDYDTVRRLLEEHPLDTNDTSDNYFHFGLHLKALTLLDSASRFGKLYSTRSDTVVKKRLASVQAVAMRFAQNLPPVPDPEVEEEMVDLDQTPFYHQGTNASLKFRDVFLAHTAAYAAIIEAYTCMSETDVHARQMCTFAARKAVELIPKYRFSDFGRSCMSPAYCWAAAVEVLGQHYKRVKEAIGQGSGADDNAQQGLVDTEGELRLLARATKQVHKYYCTLAFQAQQIDQVFIDIGLDVEDPVVGVC